MAAAWAAAEADLPVASAAAEASAEAADTQVAHQGCVVVRWKELRAHGRAFLHLSLLQHERWRRHLQRRSCPPEASSRDGLHKQAGVCVSFKPRQLPAAAGSGRPCGVVPGGRRDAPSARRLRSHTLWLACLGSGGCRRTLGGGCGAEQQQQSEGEGGCVPHGAWTCLGGLGV